MKKSENSSKRLFAIGYIALLAGAMVFGLAALPQPTHGATSAVGIVIPLYTYPTDSTWAAVIQAKQAHPNVPFIAVIDPNSGPGTSQDSNYVQGIKNLQASGVRVLGYVATGYASNSISTVVAQNGVTLLSGYTPVTFYATSGSAYTISVANCGNYVFSHWSTGSTNPSITISVTGAMTLTAYYSVTSCSPKHRNC